MILLLAGFLVSVVVGVCYAEACGHWGDEPRVWSIRAVAAFWLIAAFLALVARS